MPRVDRLWWELELQARDFQKGLDNAEKSAGRFTKFIETHPIAVAGALGAALVTVGVKAAQMAAKLETSMAKVNTQLNANQRELARYRTGVLDLFERLPVDSVDELAAGLYEILSAGVPAAKSLAVLDVAAKAAVGGLTDTKTAVDGLTTVMNAWSASGLEASEIADQFFTAAKLGKTTFPEIAQGIGQVAGLAPQLNIELDEMLGTMTALTLSGLSTSEAFSSIRRAISNVLKPQKEFIDKYPELAREFTMAKLEGDGFVKFLTDLAERVEGNKGAIVDMFGSVEALNAVLALTANGGERLTGIMTALEQSAGANERAFRTMAETTENSWKVVKNQFSVAMMDLGNNVLPAVTAELKGIVGILNLLNGTVDRIKLDAAATALGIFAANLDRITDEDKRAAAIKRLREELDKFGTRSGGIFAGSVVVQRAKELNDQQLIALQQGLAMYLRMGELAEHQRRVLSETLLSLGRETQRRGLGPGAPAAGGGGTTTTTPPPPPPAGLTPDQIAARQAMVDSARQALAQATRTAVDELELQLASLAWEAARQFGENLPVAIEEQMAQIRARIAEAKLFEPLEEEFGQLAGRVDEALELDGQSVQQTAQQSLPFLDSLIARTRLQVDTAKEGSEERKRAVALLKQELDLRKKLLPIEKESTDEEEKKADKRQEQIRQLSEMARNIEAGARGALQLAAAFGIVGDETARALENIVQIGANLPGALKGDLSSILGVAGGLAGLVTGGRRSDPEEERRREVVEQNTIAIRDLARTIGEFGLSLTGNQFGGVAGAVAEALSLSRGGGVGGFVGAAAGLTSALDRRGLTITDLERVASELGVTFDRSNLVESLRQLDEALKATELTQFAETFTGQLGALRAEFEIFDISDPIEQLKRLAAVFSDPKFGAPALRKALAGLDLSTPEGRRAAEEAIERLFQQLQAGTLGAKDLGGLTTQQFLDALREMNGLLGQGVSGESNSFAVERTITEVTGSALRAQLTTANAWLAEIAASTAAARAALERLVPPPGIGISQLPTAAQVASAFGGGGGVTIQNLTINIAGEVSPARAQAIAVEVSDALVAQIDAKLGSRAGSVQLMRGSVARGPVS